MNTAVDIAVRAQYFVQTTMGMLSKPTSDGPRNRYFALLAQFSGELSTLSAEKFSTETTKKALTDLQSAFTQYSLSTNATESEKIVMNDLVRQLQDIIVTAAPTTATVTVTAATPSTTPATTTTPSRTPTVARFYRSVPTSRFAR
jgi:hypothetical protein